MRVTTIITRLEGGAGLLALRGVLALAGDDVEPLIIAGSGGRLVDEAAGHGVEVLVEPMLRPVIAPRADLGAVRWLTAELAARRPDLVHTHCAKGGAIGGSDSRPGERASTGSCIPITDSRSTSFSRRRGAVRTSPRSAGSAASPTLASASAPEVAVEAIRRRLIAPERVRTIGVTVGEASWATPRGPAAAAAMRAERPGSGLAYRRTRLSSAPSAG